MYFCEVFIIDPMLLTFFNDLPKNLVRPSRENLELDPLSVLHLNNLLYMLTLVVWLFILRY